MLKALAELHQSIDRCTVCSEFIHPLNKPRAGLDRGEGSEIFIVGQSPGNTEQTSGRAFSGNSGARLDAWLVASGRPAPNPREGVYLTSLLKCSPPRNSNKSFNLMWHRCRHFLNDQLQLINPRIVITLGRESFEYLHFVDGDYESSIGRLFRIRAEDLLTLQPFEAILHWPHPSGLNRWHNIPGNAQRMAKSFDEIKQFLEVHY
jgi:uracil-DNA glycosylase family 4